MQLLADEILLLIIGELAHHEVLSCRRVCKKLMRVCNSISFKCLNVGPNYLGIQSLIRLSETDLRLHVREIHLTFEVFYPQRAMSLAAFTSALRPHPLLYKPSATERFFKRYQEAFCQETMWERFLMHAAPLATLLDRYQNLGHVQISQSYAHHPEDKPDGRNPMNATISIAGHQMFLSIANGLALSSN
ncbi:hypothetical protein BKA67DRAFT_537071 [Truncatella angustata]|uniref:F-box domain-containing protein n=1 Tax=Truncatella angustata TaxID=152316 RepID=A0A9P8ZW82_9PEZI|nr:uncharacterized protein BKA67DRAFT_537071 [Truncatella angustata]KAH6653385.1 hypothetical protein BKA67DRAFT_537071 [Truncatella angustata]